MGPTSPVPPSHNHSLSAQGLGARLRNGTDFLVVIAEVCGRLCRLIGAAVRARYSLSLQSACGYCRTGQDWTVDGTEPHDI